MRPGRFTAVVTDPPYGLEFMGKEWDKAGVAFDPATWQAVARVCKPGAFLLAFGGTRTWHRLAAAIEDAGWEIRDTIVWLYGTGFPKSLDISKTIDKADAAEAQLARRYRFTEWVRSTGITSRQIDDATATNMGGHYTTSASQPAIMTREHLENCRHLLGDVPEWVERDADIRSLESKNFADREVVGHSTNGIAGGTGKHAGMEAAYGFAGEFQITAPASDAAKLWSGYGTALKPAWEPVIVAMKPVDGTFAENAQRHGVAGINVDGCRIGTEIVHAGNGALGRYGILHTMKRNPATASRRAGRWPANLIHDGSPEVLEGFPEDRPGSHKQTPTHSPNAAFGGGRYDNSSCFGDSGSAARFFYCAKASRSERTAGGRLENRHPTVKPLALMEYLLRLVTMPQQNLILDPFAGSGTTLVACRRLGLPAVGIEQDPAYCRLALRRLRGDGVTR